MILKRDAGEARSGLDAIEDEVVGMDSAHPRAPPQADR